MLVTCAQMQRIEKDAFSRGVDAAALMEEAGLGIARIVQQFHPSPGHCVAFCGKGNNAGDALVALRYLQRWGWEISVDLAYPAESFSTLSAQHFASLSLDASTHAPRRIVVLDGLLGVGAQGAPRSEIAVSINRLNALREEKGAWVLAIDLPSGLDGDTGAAASPCVVADLTATIAIAKRGLVVDAAANLVGRLALIPLPHLTPSHVEGPLAIPAEIRTWLPPRPFDIHKGTCGRVGIIAGSMGLTGAARLSSAAAVAAGAGLVTLYAKEDIQPVLAASCVPEVMVKLVRSYREALGDPMDTLAVGPGLGQESSTEILGLIREWPRAMVLDADGLNAVAHDPSLLKHCAGPRLLTPHPGEMERLFPQRDRSREEWLDDFLAEYPVNLLLKGSRTIIGGPSSSARYYNTTGNPGMASGGMGDVLTGVCAALARQCGGDLLRSAVLGAWLCGRAAEIAVHQPLGSPESLSARYVIDCLGAAFADLRDGAF